MSGLRLDLYLPAEGLAMKLGPFSFDPLRAVLGFSVADLVAVWRTAPAERVQGPDGHVYELHALTLPDRAQAVREVAILDGSLGFGSEDGLLALIVPNRLVFDARNVLGSRVRLVRQHDAKSACLLADPSGEAIPIPLVGVGSIVIAFPGAATR